MPRRCLRRGRRPQGHLRQGCRLKPTPPHVRLACAAVADDDGAAAPSWLSAAELQRLAAIAAPRRRAQFVAGRRLLRRLLAAGYGGDAVADWVLTAGENRPPTVECRPAGAPAALFVSITHSGGLVACAAAEAPVGIDLELPRRPRDLDALAGAVFGAREHRAWLALDAVARASRFHTIWTLKEAWFKRRGEGLDLKRLPTLQAEPAAHGEGRVWQGGGATLALLAPADAATLWLQPAEPFGGEPQRWQLLPDEG
ncbi:hypothetical protein CKO44_01490 [Rubrivivax gelatinosus]|uniref:4'-phosphopantetheinyl transferase superfamily protein n=1 Tax=Rubrivivax gelatinosus TaxID=28068 RepID=UPI0019041364|nr:hypothetical protein [Rubrivivax gelatinosus]